MWTKKRIMQGSAIWKYIPEFLSVLCLRIPHDVLTSAKTSFLKIYLKFIKCVCVE